MKLGASAQFQLKNGPVTLLSRASTHKSNTRVLHGDVRITLKSRHRRQISECLLSAKKRQTASQQLTAYSIT